MTDAGVVLDAPGGLSAPGLPKATRAATPASATTSRVSAETPYARPAPPLQAFTRKRRAALSYAGFASAGGRRPSSAAWRIGPV
jgi:hypothetical protein